MKEKISRQVMINTSPDRIYEVLTTSEKFSALSQGASAEIDPNAGGAFSLFGGMIEGRNLQCDPGKLLVQAWRAKNWEDGFFSIVRFALEGSPGGTSVTLEHTNFPAGLSEHLNEGWGNNYLDPLAKMFEGGA